MNKKYKSLRDMETAHYPKIYLHRSLDIERRHKLRRVFGEAPSCLPSSRLCELLYWACRRIQLWLCFYEDDVEIDVEDLLSNPFNTQPPPLDELIRATGFNKDWIMFMYRNFKQICSNGRMSLQQWRRIFQMIFPKSANTEFADRLFRVTAGSKIQKHITFEELILCLHRISECNCAHSSSTSSQNSSAHSSKIAQFIFLLMEPDDEEQINLDSFEDYAEAVFNLNARSVENNSQHFFSQMSFSSDHNGSTQAVALQFSSNFRSYVLRCFNEMDTDNDGVINAKDVERVLTSACTSPQLFKQTHLLHSS
ncbi:unnamed protein product [Litomosoides sigmodontis]|uniref:EF-hand domain-containing protein n=1 Tax=Litomosoides sigmodontis TaxID=42156 RepID=A0A3P6S1B1_LITSI|nr:unnamed protein product [Litomosoides sigmodontis]